MISIFCIYCIFLLAARNPKEKKTVRIEKSKKKQQQLFKYIDVLILIFFKI